MLCELWRASKACIIQQITAIINFFAYKLTKAEKRANSRKNYSNKFRSKNEMMKTNPTNGFYQYRKSHKSVKCKILIIIVQANLCAAVRIFRENALLMLSVICRIIIIIIKSFTAVHTFRTFSFEWFFVWSVDLICSETNGNKQQLLTLLRLLGS